MAQVANNVSSLLLSVLLLFIASGCGGATGDGFAGERGQVTGKITLDGQPLQSGCQVIFMSTKGGFTAAGVVGKQGAYSLNYSDNSGLPAAEYEVQLTAPVVVAAADSGPTDPTKMAEKMKLNRKTTATPGDGPFPAKYGSTSTSKLTYTVKAGPNTADFNLQKK